MFSVEIDVSRLRSAIRSASEKLSKDLHTDVAQAASAAIQSVKSSHPYKDRTGALTKSLAMKLGPQSRYKSTADLMARVPYASFQEFGSQPHVIQPRHARGSKHGIQTWTRSTSRGRDTSHLVGVKWKSRVRRDGQAARPMLVFWNRGKLCIVPMVHHPGTRPKHFMTDAALRAALGIGDRMPSMFARWAKNISDAR